MSKIITNKTVVAVFVFLAAAVYIAAFSFQSYYSRQIFENVKRSAPAIVFTKISFGTLKGKIFIGPLCPVEPCDLSADRISEIYKARQIFIYSNGTKERVGQASVKAGGDYQISLAEGKYIVNVSDGQGKETALASVGRVLGSATPQNAEIAAGRTTVLDFEVDTGIR